MLKTRDAGIRVWVAESNSALSGASPHLTSQQSIPARPPAGDFSCAQQSIPSPSLMLCVKHAASYGTLKLLQIAPTPHMAPPARALLAKSRTKTSAAIRFGMTLTKIHARSSCCQPSLRAWAYRPGLFKMIINKPPTQIYPALKQALDIPHGSISPLITSPLWRLASARRLSIRH